MKRLMKSIVSCRKNTFYLLGLDLLPRDQVAIPVLFLCFLLLWFVVFTCHLLLLKSCCCSFFRRMKVIHSLIECILFLQLIGCQCCRLKLLAFSPCVAWEQGCRACWGLSFGLQLIRFSKFGVQFGIEQSIALALQSHFNVAPTHSNLVQSASIAFLSWRVLTRYEASCSEFALTPKLSTSKENTAFLCLHFHNPCVCFTG